MRGLRIAHPVDRMAFQAQRGTQAVADHAVVFDEEQAHGASMKEGRAGSYAW